MSTNITTEQFNSILGDILRETNALELLSIPGIAEILLEYYNNAIIDIFEEDV